MSGFVTIKNLALLLCGFVRLVVIEEKRQNTYLKTFSFYKNTVNNYSPNSVSDRGFSMFFLASRRILIGKSRLHKLPPEWPCPRAPVPPMPPSSCAPELLCPRAGLPSTKDRDRPISCDRAPVPPSSCAPELAS